MRFQIPHALNTVGAMSKDFRLMTQGDQLNRHEGTKRKQEKKGMREQNNTKKTTLQECVQLGTNRSRLTKQTSLDFALLRLQTTASVYEIRPRIHGGTTLKTRFVSLLPGQVLFFSFSYHLKCKTV